MPSTALPGSDLAQLAQNVLSQPFEAALPCNLNESWLQSIARDLAHGFGELDAGSSACDHLAAPLTLVLHLLRGQGRTQELISHDELMTYLNEYRVEIALELVNRTTPA